METKKVDKTNLINEELKERTKLQQEEVFDSMVLKPSIKLNAGKYEILGQLGEMGGFGVTYLAQDHSLNAKVAIKEYFPRDFAGRTKDKTVTATKKGRKSFDWGYSAFVEEARTIAKLPKHPNVIDVKNLFEENGTAYFVMSYEEGQDLESYIRDNHPLSQEEIENIIFPFLKGVKHIHKHDILHRDIKPANILITKENEPILIDFGTARNQLLQRSKKLTAVYTEGYASPEQHAQTKEGNYTDIYAIGMLIYAMINGITDSSLLPNATKRYQALNDKKISLLTFPDGNRFSKKFIDAVKGALELEIKDRPQSIDAFISLLEKGKDKKIFKKITLFILALITFITLLVGGYYLVQKVLKDDKIKPSISPPTTNTLPQALKFQQDIQQDINYYGEAKLFKAQGAILKAIEYFKISVKKDNNAESAFELGLIYNLKKNKSLAKKWFLKSEQLGNERAKYPLAIAACEQGNYTKVTKNEEVLNYAKGSTKEVKYDVAVCFQKVEKITEAKKWFEESSKMGYRPAIKSLYLLLINQFNKSNNEAKEYIDSLSNNNEVSQIDYYKKGMHLLEEEKYDEAIASFKKSSDNGNANAMFKLALIYEFKEEKKKAILWYKKAKKAKNPKAKYRLAVLSCEMKNYDYLNDFVEYAIGSKKEIQYDLALCFKEKGDTKNARKWFKISGERGLAVALYQFAILSNKPKERQAYLKKSADKGYAEAAFRLGKELYENEEFTRSKNWFKKASTLGSKMAKEYLKRMKELNL